MGNKQNDPERLTDIVPEYHSRNPVLRHLFQSRLAAALEMGELDAPTPLDVLDLGCGEGVFVIDARASFPRNHYFGWDIHPGIQELRAPGVEFSRVDIRDRAAVSTRRFDRLFCLDVLEHFPCLEDVLANVRGLLKPDGRLILSEPTESWFYKLGRLVVKGTLSAHEGPAAGPHYFDAWGVDIEVRKAGFERVELRKIPTPPLTLFHILCYRPLTRRGEA